MSSESSRQTLTSANSTAFTTERSRSKRGVDTPVKHRAEASERVLPTPNSARQHRPAWRGVTPSHNNKADAALPLLTPRKLPLGPALRAVQNVPPSASKHRGTTTNSPPDSPRSTGDFSSFSDGDWEDNLADNVKVITRIRPASQTELEGGGEGSELCVTQAGARGVAVASHRYAQPYEFAYDHVSGEMGTQDDLFMMAGHPMVENCLAGYNSSIFAYGQTGAGKTYTMIGQLGRSDQRGLAPRVFEYIFKRISEEEDKAGRDQVRFSVKCSFLEIYNETITDLLKPSSGNLNLREDMKRGCYVDNLTEEIVLNVEDALNVMRKGTENRRIGETNLNRESSRSHSVFTCIMESSSKGAEDGCTRVKFSRLNLVDLAGSERNKLSGATGEHFKEACSINKSLTCLGRVIMELVEAQRMGRRHTHIPYRDSRLTFLLQDSLGGNAKTMIIANVSPCRMCVQETLSTLQFASRAKHIRNKAVINQDTNGDVAMLQREVSRLRRELNLVRDECTEPVVRENLELQERLIAAEQARALVEDKLTLTRSEVRKHKEQAEWAEKKVADFDRQRKVDDESQQSSHKEQVDALWHRLEAASEAHKQQLLEKQQEMEAAAEAGQQQLQQLEEEREAAIQLHQQEEQQLQQKLESAAEAYRQQQLEKLQELQAAEEAGQQQLQQLREEQEAALQLHQQEKEQLQQKLEAAAEAHRQQLCQKQHELEAVVEADEQRVQQLQQEQEAAAEAHEQQAQQLQEKLKAASQLHQQEEQQLMQKLEQLQEQLQQSDDACSQARQEMTAQQAQHEAQVLDLNDKAVQAADLTQQHVAQLSTQEADLAQLRQQLSVTEEHLAESQTSNAQLQGQTAALQDQVSSREEELARGLQQLEEEERSKRDAQAQLQQVSEQLQQQQQAAADTAAELRADVSQLQQHLLSAQTEAEETHAAAKLRQIEHENQTHELEQELEHAQRCLSEEKQSNGELAEAIRRQRRAAAKQDAEAAGREHKHQDELSELRKALMLLQQDLEAKKEELQHEVVRSTKYKNVHLKIQDAISEVSDCMTPAGSSRYRILHGSLRHKQHPWDLLPDSPRHTGLIAASSHNPVSAVAGAQEEEEEELPVSQLDSESSNAENTAPGVLQEQNSPGKRNLSGSPRKSRATGGRAEGNRASTGSSASVTQSSVTQSSRGHSRKQLPHLQISEADATGFNPLSPNNR